MKYDHKKIESKWQKFWQDHKTFKVEIDSRKPKYYVLDMFPYPSGAGLHVGHLIGYTATDILARYKRQKGFNVLHPMGWDSFGLPAEQYAIRTGTHPAVTTKTNVDNFRRQMKAIGYCYDWDREFATSDPSYFKWTQWIFTKLFEKGLAYEAELPVNYCPALGTVLANEEVENGKSKEGGHPVEKRPLRQWVLKITAYAERLIKDLDLVDWPESLKKLQINWIGKSEGALIDFRLASGDEKITVFTTRADTLFGVTFLVVAPEHPLVEKLVSSEQADKVKAYQRKAAGESEVERTDLTKAKTGVFTGGYVTNPANEKKVPVWIADYVLMGYGTGAVMGVPCDDERDFAFAQQYNLPIVPVIDPGTAGLKDSNEDPEEIRQQVLAGKRCWGGEEGEMINSQNGELTINGLSIAEANQKVTQWLESKGIGKATVTYKLRDWLFSRQRYWGEPFPILHFEDGTKRALEIDELPLLLPEISEFKPSGDGQSPLARASEWINTIDPKTGKKAKRESNTMPNWAGSCWYYLRFRDPHNAQEAWSSEAEDYWGSVDLYVGGVEHAVLHLLYSRFWHKVLYDCGYVKQPEPFLKLRNQGLMVARSYQNSNNVYIPPSDVIERDGKYFHRETGEELKSQIDKMSKSKLNGVSPDDVVEEFGTDALRLYEMFMGPLEKEKVWNTDAVSGCKRFLNRFYDMAFSEKLSNEDTTEALKLGHRLVHGVGKDTEALQFNTAVAKMMEFINGFTQLPTYPRSVVKMATIALFPFAPHLAEEIWEALGGKSSLSDQPFPEVDERYLQDESVTYVVQVNGKVRGRFDLPKDQPQDVILEAAKQHSGIIRFLDGVKIQKIVFVPNKLLSLVVE